MNNVQVRKTVKSSQATSAKLKKNKTVSMAVFKFMHRFRMPI